MMESHSLMLVSWQKRISPSNFQRYVTFGVISTRVFLRRFMSSKLTLKFHVQTHKIGASTLNLDNHEKFQLS